MPEPAISAEQYSNLVRERVAALRRLLLDLTRKAPQSAPHRFFSAVRILIDAVERVFSSRCKAIESQPGSKEERATETAFAARWTMELLNNAQAQFFPFLEKLDSPHVPLWMLPAMQRIASQFEPNVELYLFPTSEHNFGFSGFRDLLRAFVQKFELAIPDDLKVEIEERAAKLPQWFVFLSFPYVVHDSALHLTPLLHELGHFADFRLGIYKELLPIDISQSDAARKVVEEICQMRVPMGAPESKIEGAQQPGVEPRVEEILQRDVIEQQVFALCGQIIRNWVHELISDLFAVRMGGPAYFYSFATFAANLRLDARAGASHPSPSMRIDLMLKELSDLHYSSEYSPLQVRSSLESWRRWLETQPLEPEEPPTRVAYWAIKENESKLVEAVRKHTSAFSYGTRAYTEKVKYVVNDLEAGIPPIDRAGDGEAAFDACDLVDILNGAWTTYMFSPEKLESLIECPPPERKLRGVSVLNELVQKAIEASEILRQCHKRSKGGV